MRSRGLGTGTSRSWTYGSCEIDHEEVQFGEGAEQIIIHSRDPEFKESSIALLDAGDVIFRMSSEDGEIEIDGSNKIHAKCFVRNMLREVCPTEAIIDESEFIITGIATRVSKCLTKASSEVLDQCDDMKTCVDKGQVIKAARFLFDNPQIETQEVEQYEWSYSAGLVEGTASFPPSLSAQAKLSSWYAKDVWKSKLETSRCLVVLLLALAHVQNFESHPQLLLRHYSLLHHQYLVDILCERDGKTYITVSDDTWFNAIATLLAGTLDDPTLDTVCLMSSRGWSVFFTTFGNNDPGALRSGYVSIFNGVPARNDVRKHGIVDVPQSGSGLWMVAGQS